jgi:hypothetical protein
VAIHNEGDAGRSDHPEVVERLRALAPGDEVGRGDHVSHGAAAVGLPNRNDAIGLVIGQRFEQHGADDAEDCGRGTDAERQRDERGSGEAGRPPQYAKAVTDIAERVLEQSGPNLISHALPRPFDTAELQHRLAARFCGAQTRPAQLLGLLIEVEANFFVEPTFERAAADHRAEPGPPVRDPSHGRLLPLMWPQSPG